MSYITWPHNYLLDMLQIYEIYIKEHTDIFSFPQNLKRINISEKTACVITLWYTLQFSIYFSSILYQNEKLGKGTSV